MHRNFMAVDPENVSSSIEYWISNVR